MTMILAFARALALVACVAAPAVALAQEEGAIRPEVPKTSDRAIIDRARVLKHPEYPDDAIVEGVSGTVAVRLLLTANGEIVSARAVSGPVELRAVAAQAVRAWEFNSSPVPDNVTGFVVFEFAAGEHYAKILGLRDQEIALAATDEPAPPPPPAATRRPVAQTEQPAARQPSRERTAAPPAEKPAEKPAETTEPQPVPSGVLLANADRKVAPRYPPAAANARVEGTVVVEVVVDETGKVVEASAVSGHVLLREAAVSAARDWTFKPSVSGGKARKVRSTIVFMFRR
jgi:TonB family protein